MTFLHSEYLYLMLVPLLIFIYFVATNQNSLERYYSKEVLKKIRISDGSIGQKGRNIFLFISLILMVIALARPVLPKGEVLVKSNSVDILIGIDVSKSMLADDLYPNRLEFVKKRVLEFMDSFKKARFGVMAFSSVGFLVSPVSEDIPTVKYLVKNLNSDSVNQKGTDLFQPLRVAKDILKDEKEKVLVLFTDGGEGKDFSKEIDFARKNNIRVFIYGVGTKKGSTIKENGKLLKDKNGDIVIVRLNDAIKELAIKSGGTFIVGDYSGKSLKEMENSIKKEIKKTREREKKVKIYKELFYYPLMAALALLLFGFSSMPSKKGFKAAFLISLLFVSFNVPLKAGIFDFQTIKKAKELYQNKEYKKSEEIYRDLLKNKNNSAELRYDFANSLYKQKKYKEALKEYEKIKSDKKELKFKKYFNEGNALAHLKKFDEAIKEYKEALKLKPNDKDAKYNLELVKKLKKHKENQEKKSKRDKQNKKSKSNKKNKNGSGKNDKNQKNGKDNSHGKNQNQKKEKKKKNNSTKNRDKKKEQKGKKEQEKKSRPKNLQQKKAEAGKVDKKIMSDAEEKKWLRMMLNKKSKTLPLELNTKVHKIDKNNQEW